MTAPSPRTPAFREVLATWFKIGLTGFGGPAGQIALLQRTLVEEKRWLGQDRFLHALSFCTFLPGPEAMQLATYCGWLLHGYAGGIAAGVLFVLPGSLALVALSLLYVYGLQSAIVAGLFFGLKSAVLAVVIEAALRLWRRLAHDSFFFLLSGGTFLALFAWSAPFPLVIAVAGLAGWIRARFSPDAAGPVRIEADSSAARNGSRHLLAVLSTAVFWALPVLALLATLGPDHVLSQVAVFFSKAAVVTFGGAYAVLAYVGQQAVEHYGWLAPGQMLDGLGLAETTPGPLILVLQFVGFLAAWNAPAPFSPLVAALLGAAITSWVTFVPSLLFIFLGAPWMETLRNNRALSGSLGAISAAVVGVILNLATWFAIHALFTRVTVLPGPLGSRLLLPDPRSLDPAAAAIAALSLVLLLRVKLGMLPTLGVAALLGIAARALL